MKKLFIFAAIAAAGLLTSCSSSDDIAVNEAQNPIEDADARQAIRLNLATPGAMVTRGTGTVGGVGTDNTADNYIANVWRGQTINVFMFTKGIEADNNVTPAVAADPYATVLKLTEADNSTAAAPVYLYSNQAMITPGSSANKINGENTDDDGSGEAMIADGTIQYYPPQGYFDFFGYHGDNAVAATPTITKTDALWTVPVAIDGSQDIMSTKAELTATQSTKMGTSKEYYSAKAARKGVHPTLTFKHLLTRLQFNVVAGNDAAAGYTADAPTVTDLTKVQYDALDPDDADDAAIIAQCVIKDYTVAATVATTDWPTDAAVIAVAETYWEPDVPAAPTVYNKKAGVTTITKAVYDALPAALQDTKYFTIANYTRTQPATTGTLVAANAVKVTSIQVLSENTEGDLAVAWTGDKADYEKISWATTQPAEANRWLTLKERPYKKNTEDAPNQTWLEAYKNKTDGEITALTGDEATAYATALAALTASINQAVYNTLSATGKTKYDVDENAQLVGLSATAPTIDGTKADKAAGRYPASKVGESLILSPGTYDQNGVAQTGATPAATTKLRMKVGLSQLVPTNWNTPDVRTEKTQSYELDINAPAGGFKQNTSYNVKLTVYGLERIEVIAVVEPWIDGGNLEVGED